MQQTKKIHYNPKPNTVKIPDGPSQILADIQISWIIAQTKNYGKN